MKKYKKVVVVEPTQPGAYNPERPISDLVRNQILHLSVAERGLEKRHQSPLDVHAIKTERQASEYIHHLTQKLHKSERKSRVVKKNKLRTKRLRRKSRSTNRKR